MQPYISLEWMLVWRHFMKTENSLSGRTRYPCLSKFQFSELDCIHGHVIIRVFITSETVGLFHLEPSFQSRNDVNGKGFYDDRGFSDLGNNCQRRFKWVRLWSLSLSEYAQIILAASMLRFYSYQLNSGSFRRSFRNWQHLRKTREIKR